MFQPGLRSQLAPQRQSIFTQTQTEDPKPIHDSERQQAPHPNPLKPELGTASSKVQATAPIHGFDENGTELHRDARVWNVYVSETDKFDMELAQEWNDSTEVILIFAALFSAISTAFLIESSKLLQEDPAEVSKQTLVVMSQTLLIIANGTQAPGSIATNPSTGTDFVPRYFVVCVNVLWFLSLSLSLATSFIAMMAKDWCHSFLAGRTGHPFSQTCRRQQKWDMIERWKMQELLSVLPSLMHAALVLFAVGLGIHLWNLNTAVAIPVIVVTGAAIGFYVFTSIGAIVLDSFPYPTIVSRLCRGKGIVRKGFEYAYWLVLAVASYPPLQLLFVPVLWSLTGVMLVAWLCLTLLLMVCTPFDFIKPYLDGWDQYVMASGYLPLQIVTIPPLSFARLFVCHPAAKIARWSRDSSRWLNSKVLPMAYRALQSFLLSMRTWRDLNSKPVSQEDSHGSEQNDVISRALAWLIVNCEVPQSVDTALQVIAGATDGVPRQPLLECNATLEILRRLASSNLYRASNAQTDATVSLYARALAFLGNSADSGADDAKHGEEGALEGLTWSLHLAAEKEVAALIVDDDFKPTRSNLKALQIGSTAASTSLKILNEDPLAHTNTVFANMHELFAQYLNDEQTLHEAALLSLTNAAIVLYPSAPEATIASSIPRICFRLAASDHHCPAPHVQIIIGLMATCMLWSSNTLVDQARLGLDNRSWSRRAMRQLISIYSQDEVALKMVSTFGLQVIAASPKSFHIEDFDEHTQTTALQDAASRLNVFYDGFEKAIPSDPLEIAREDVVLSYLRAFRDSSELLPIGPASSCIPFFSLTEICNFWYLPPSSPARAKREELLSTFRFPTLSGLLVWILEARDIIPKLEAIMTSHTRHGLTKFIAAGQLWLLFTLYLDPSDGTSEDRDKLGAELRKYKKNDPQNESARRASLGTELRQLWKSLPQSSVPLKETWAARVMECVYELQESEPPRRVRWNLRNVPKEIRGLRSFTGRKSGGETPPIADAQTTKSQAKGKYTTTDATHATHDQPRVEKHGTPPGTEVAESKSEGAGAVELIEMGEDSGEVGQGDGMEDHRNGMASDRQKATTAENIGTRLGGENESSGALNQDNIPEHAGEDVQRGPHVTVDMHSTGAMPGS